jgi:predicted RND superfamily exporter protein
MDTLACGIIRHRKLILIIFIALTIVSLLLIPTVSVNYNMTDYLPADAQSTKALEIMKNEFSDSIPNASVLVHDVSLTEALECKRQLASVNGVEDVTWLDNIADIHQPLETLDQSIVENYYKNGNALFSVTIAEDMESAAISAMRTLVGKNNAVTGQASDSADLQQATTNETVGAMTILLPAVLIILIISTRSWLEPLIFLAGIGISILINMGTNIFFGEISFITNSVSPILQLAVSLDYAVFILHSFSSYRQKYGDVERAMRYAIRTSMSTVAASALTTLFGFIALTFMDFGIGIDLGIILAKGIVLSFLSCAIFLPALILSIYKLLDKTQHRPFLPNFQNINRLFSKLMLPVAILVLLILIPSFLGQGKTGFIYGSGNVDIGTINGQQRVMVQDAFGKNNTMVLLVPTKELATEAALCEDLEQLSQVDSVLSFSNTVGTTIPKDILSEQVVDQFYSDHYSRIIVNMSTPDEGELAFRTVEEITAIAEHHYGDEIYTAGQSAALYDMKQVVQDDNWVVTLIAVVSIFLVLLFTFKSFTLPFILLLTIEAAIWINLSIPYFTGISINFLGYLVLNTVQLGATIDYAILLTNTYMRNRKKMLQKQAMHATMASAFPSILVSALILSVAGFTLYATTSTAAVADIGELIGRGTILSAVMVLCFLPAMLKVFDNAIAKTTRKANFYIVDSQLSNKSRFRKSYRSGEKQNEKTY